ncbi:hypothetical protein MRX96_055642 [Rhipicephalus microplus]
MVAAHARSSTCCAGSVGGEKALGPGALPKLRWQSAARINRTDQAPHRKLNRPRRWCLARAPIARAKRNPLHPFPPTQICKLHRAVAEGWKQQKKKKQRLRRLS